MDTFIVEPRDAGDPHIVFQDRGVPRRRMAEPLQRPTDPRKHREEAPAAAAPIESPTRRPFPEPLSRSSSRLVDTRRWMHDATESILDALLRPAIPKDASRAWSGVIAIDVEPLLERHETRERRWSAALQTAIETAHPDRAVALASERDKLLPMVERECDALDDEAAAYAECIDAAINAGIELRHRAVRSRRRIDEVSRELQRMCRPVAFRKWAPHVRRIILEEADAAYRSLESKAEEELGTLRTHRPLRVGQDAAAARRDHSVDVATNSHLQNLVGAIEARRKLRAVRVVQEAAIRTLPLLASSVTSDRHEQ